MPSIRCKAIRAAVSAALFVSAVAQADGPTLVSPGIYQGPSSSQPPYVKPTAPGWEVVSLITVGDSAKDGAYPMVGVPDGLGAVAGRFDPKSGAYGEERTFMTVFMNHELLGGQGDKREHGQTGAFVSQWTVHLDTLAVTRGEDLIRTVKTWNRGARRYDDTTGTTIFNLFCSADLPPRTAFYNPHNGKGFDGLIFMTGEERAPEGRAFAHIVSGSEKGTAYELPYLGRFAWENALAHPDAGDKTIVVGLDDSIPGPIYVYIGEKEPRGNPVERAGLHGGKLYGVQVTNGGANYGNGPAPQENNGAIEGTFKLVDASDAAMSPGRVLRSTSAARKVTGFARPEDGAWDTRDPKVFYFVVTGAKVGGKAQTSRLYKLTFDSLEHPTGGAIRMVVDSASLIGTDGEQARSFDNITVDKGGNVLIQEDPGRKAYIAKTWLVDPGKPLQAVQILESDRERFAKGAARFLTLEEESSGVIEVTDIVRSARWADRYRRYYLGVMQAHYPVDTPGLVQGGQLYLFASPVSGRDASRNPRADVLQLTSRLRR